MSRYIDWKDVVDRYRTLSDKDSTEVGSSFIPYAESEVDGRLAAKFTTPFSNNNLTVKDLCIDITFIKAGNLSVEETEKLQEAVDAKFERLLNGDELLVITDGTVIGQDIAGTVYSTTQDYHPVFGMGNIEDMVVSSDQITDEADARS